MLVTTRLYKLQTDGRRNVAALSRVKAEATFAVPSPQSHVNMLLLHQIGSVRVGEVVRYTVTYTPSQDRILPKPSKLHLKIRNTSAIALRAAYLHGPYTLYAACYPSTFDPNVKSETGNAHGLPQFEANLKAGGAWTADLIVPGDIKETTTKAHTDQESGQSILSCSWIVEISSQVLFSTSATVHFELLVGRDASSVELGSNLLPGAVHAPPGEVNDHLHLTNDKHDPHRAQAKGVFSRAIGLVVEDTARLWDKPHLSEHDRRRARRPRKRSSVDQTAKESIDLVPTNTNTSGQSNAETKPKQKRVHLVVITHGLHSNTGADMLYLKESIDAAAKEARIDRRKRRAALRKRDEEQKSNRQSGSLDRSKGKEDTSLESGGVPTFAPEAQHDSTSKADESEEEEVVVRGFSGNVIRTERGLQYLGKRLAKYVLTITYPDQPVLPTKQSVAKRMSKAFTGSGSHGPGDGRPSHAHSSMRDESKYAPSLPYRITSISFIGHSLGGLTQTYAIAYIQKHSPTFFQSIRPINFIALATPFLGLNHENPMYVKFALDFGLVGKTGQDLGLAWRAPNFARSGWAALIGGTGADGQRSQKHLDPGSKPLLRLLPTGPAHQVLKMFRNRTVYANVVNDGIVPLRTSCLLFLDWRGLGRVEKARRENGLVGTMASWGWAEVTGVNSSQRSHRRDMAGDGMLSDVESESEPNTPNGQKDGETVPQPAENATADDTTVHSGVKGQEEPSNIQFLNAQGQAVRDEDYDAKTKGKASPSSTSSGPLSSFLSFLMPHGPQSHHHQPKYSKIYKRGQTIGQEQNRHEENQDQIHDQSGDAELPSSTVSRGDTLNKSPSNVFAPPKTTVFESAGDILNPPLPPIEYLMDPTTRPRTIFHDRIYHPQDIPLPPPTKRRSTLFRSFSGDPKNPSTRSSTFSTSNGDSNSTLGEQQSGQPDTLGGLKVEEKTARAYHKDLSWRKVLVRLEPDAHNNIIVRRMFSNAYGWPVIKHLVDTHFADTVAAATDDAEEPSEERARPMDEAVGQHGEEVTGQAEAPTNLPQAVKWADGEEAPLKCTDTILSSRSGRPKIMREETALSSWDDRYFEGSSDEDDSDIDVTQDRRSSTHAHRRTSRPPETPTGTDAAEIADFLSASPQRQDSGDEAATKTNEDATLHTLGLPPELSLESTRNSSTPVGLHAPTHDPPMSAGKQS